MPEDVELLRRYLAEKSEEAFAELVRRHLDLVYSVALRHVGGDAHMAQDVAQVVFTTLARKAGPLSGRPVLAGWLYRATRFAAIDAVRSEARRHRREQEARTMDEFSTDPEAPADWDKLRPLLERAIADLNQDDRDAVVLRFFNGCSFAEVGAKLRLTENAARMRVQRALGKLHATLARRGCTSTAAAIALALANAPSIAAPAGMAAAVTTGALQGAAAGGAAVWLGTFMSASKLQIGIAGVVAAAGLGGYAVQEHANRQLRDELGRLQSQTAAIAATRNEVAQLAATAAEVAELRNDDAELGRLADEARQLKVRMDAAERARAQLVPARGAAAVPTGQPVYDIAHLDRRPVPTFQARPLYPIALRRSGTEGEAKVSFVIDVNGSPKDIKVVEATQPEFGDSAKAAIEKWRFKAGQKAGANVNTRVVVPIVFTVNSNSGPPPSVPDWF